MPQAEFKISTMCSVLRVSRSGYYSWLRRGPSRWGSADRQLLPRIRQVLKASHGRYGVHRIRAALRHAGHRVSPRRILRLMAAAGLQDSARRSRRSTTRADGSTVATEPALEERARHRAKAYLLLVEAAGEEFARLEYDPEPLAQQIQYVKAGGVLKAPLTGVEIIEKRREKRRQRDAKKEVQAVHGEELK